MPIWRQNLMLTKKTLRRSINEAKRLYYTRTLNYIEITLNRRGLYLNTLCRKMFSVQTTNFVLNNRMITNLDKIATELNKYFVNIGRSFNDQIQAVQTSDDYLLQHNQPETTFNFASVNKMYIDDVINKSKNKSSYGYYTISNKHIKYSRNVLARPLTLLRNQCIHIGTCIYLKQLKISRVKPLHK